ncbi:putative ribonuclease H-like domain-containing protein, partial [Tanacetum coccineum]
AQGHRQEEGIDYDEVFAPVARIEAIRIFLAFASYMGFIVYQMDVKSAFLYGKIDEEVYVSQPPGFIDPKRGTIDNTLFIKKDKHDIILVQVYVDDIIFGSTKKSWCDEFEALMKSRFQMSSVGELTFFLGLQVKQTEDGIFISQDKSMIGSLMYLTASRPDIIFAVCACSRVSSFNLEAYSDSDYARANLDRKSTIGALISLSPTITNSTTMVVLESCPKHNMVAYLEKTEGNAAFHEIIDFLKRSSIHNALTVSPVVSTTFVEQFWMSAKSKIINNVRYITAKVAGKLVSISEA